MTNIINLPEDLVLEILSRIPAVSLARLRSTSKGWNALIGDGRLAKKHSANAPKQSLVIVVINLRVCLLSVDLRGIHDNVAPSAKVSAQFSLKDASEEVDIREVFHCDGLLLCTTTDDRLVVWNPCSGETRWIPIPSKHYDKEIHIYAIGKSSCNKYKILRVDRLNRYEYEIYDLTSDSWTCVGVITDLFSFSSGGGIAMKGNTYWCASPESEGSLLVCFDYSTEKFTRLSLPEDPDTLAYSALDLTVTREGQQLCLLSTSFAETTQTNVWIATKIESTGAMSWSKFLTMSRTRTDLIYSLQFMMGTRFLFDEENKVVLSCYGPTGHSKNIIHIIGEDKYIDVNHHGAKPTSLGPFLLSYVPSLVQIKEAI